MSRALIFGGLGGIGAAVCESLAARATGPMTIDVVDVRSVDAPSHVDLHVVDLTDDGARDNWLTKFLSDVGSPDLVAWCAGRYLRRDIRDYSTDELRAVIDLNLTAFLAMLPRLVGAAVSERRPMRMVIVGSQAGVTGGLDVAYAAAKAGLVAAVKSVAREYARSGITANVVSPGPVETPMANVMGDERRRYYESTIPLGRYSTAQEVASAVTWLLTEAPEAVNGTVLDVDGGLVRR